MPQLTKTKKDVRIVTMTMITVPGSPETQGPMIPAVLTVMMTTMTIPTLTTAVANKIPEINERRCLMILDQSILTVHMMSMQITRITMRVTPVKKLITPEPSGTPGLMILDQSILTVRMMSMQITRITMRVTPVKKLITPEPSGMPGLMILEVHIVTKMTMIIPTTTVINRIPEIKEVLFRILGLSISTQAIHSPTQDIRTQIKKIIPVNITITSDIPETPMKHTYT